jgi:hypothetical protein
MLTDREVQIADFVGDEQHSLKNWRQIKEAHFVFQKVANFGRGLVGKVREPAVQLKAG